METAKSEHYNILITQASGNQMELFKIIGGLLHTKGEDVLPQYEDPLELANRFNDFFLSKIETIRLNLVTASGDNNETIDTESPSSVLDMFAPADVDEISKLITSASNASSKLDPLPTSLLNEIKPALATTITDIVNKSLSTGVFPSSMKKALIKPLLKKQGLDSNTLKNYRPVSNLSFISKVIEKVVAVRLTKYMTEHHLMERMQSAYRSCHSTETALLRVQNDILHAIDKKKNVILTLLDLSAAFDTIDHGILLDRLEKRLGIRGVVLEWLRSYLTGRSQAVSIAGKTSGSSNLLYGVPQGSVLGPILFTIYTLPIADITQRHNVNAHVYADDSQLYVSYNVHKRQNTSADSAVAQIQNCICEIRTWMSIN